MNHQLQVQRIEDCNSWLEEMAGGADVQVQSIAWYIEQINMLCKALPFVNSQMAIARKVLNDKKVTAYTNLLASEIANQMYFAPSLAKDYISAKLSQDQYNYDICERASRSIVHICDAYRSCLSALKEEVKTLNYQR